MSKFVMNTKSIALIIGIAIVILVVIIVPGNQESDSDVVIPSQVIDEPQLQEDVTVGTEVVEESSPEEIVLIKNEDGPDYWIDENGVKHFVLSAIDSPNFGE